MQKNLKKGRVAVALLFFIAIVIAFSDVKGVLPAVYYKAVFYLQFTPSIVNFLTPGAVFTVGFLAIIIITLIAGRVYCSTICPLGVLQDAVIWLKRKIFPKKRLRFKTPLNILRYSILLGMTISLLFSGILFINLLDPYANFGRIASHIIQPIIIWSNNIVAGITPNVGLHQIESSPWHVPTFIFSVSVLILVLIMSWTKGRLYCNTVCPVGAFLGLLSKMSIYKIKINPTSCSQCGKCQATCKSNCIDVSNMTIDASRCVACYNCISECEENSIGYVKTQKKQIQQASSSDKKRRLFLATTIGYLFYKSIPLNAQRNRNQERKKQGAGIRFFERGVVAPPGSLSIEHLKSACVGCNLCVSVCPTKVLQPAFLEYGVTGMMVPRMDYSAYFCNYDCTKCGEVCPTGAIVRLTKDEKQLTQIGKVQFAQHHCVVESEGTSCGSCSEHCPTQAVSMQPYRDGLTIPQINRSICIGCGACEYACPVISPHKAIFVSSNEVHQLAEKPVAEKLEYKETEDFPF